MADPITAGFVALKAGSSIMKGKQEAAQSMNEAARADAAARLADTQALQRDTAARDDLTRFLSSVKASRAANGLSANSPNARVLEADAVSRADDDRLRQRADDRQRAANFRAASKGYQKQAKYSLINGYVAGATSIAQGMM